MAKGKKKEGGELKPGRKRLPEKVRQRKPLWPWFVLGGVLLVVAVIIGAGFWGASPPSSYNCLKLCYPPVAYDGASGITFDKAVGWAEFDKERRIGLTFPPASQVGFFIDAPSSGRLEYAIGLSMTIFRYAERIDVVTTFTSKDGRQIELERQSYDPRKASMAGRWHDRRVELPKNLGSGRIGFEVRGIAADAPEGAVFIGNPRIIKYDNRRRTRVIFIAVDALRADHLRAYGYNRDTSPNIDSFAKKGTLFEDCEATSPWTFTSFGSIFTGKYPSANGATTVSKFLRDDEETFAEALSRNGFLTCAVTNNVWFSPSFNLLQGFDTQRDFDNIAEISCDYAGKWLSANRDVDCVLFMHLIDPHMPYSPPGEYATKYDPHYEGPYKTYFNGIDDYREGKLEITPKLNEHLIDLYDGEIAYTDNALSKFLTTLQTSQLMDGSTIIFTSDHGEEFLDHGSIEHGHSMYGELLHVPLMISGPGFKAGKKVGGIASPMDLGVTLMAMFGGDMPAGVQGFDLRDVIKGRIGTERRIYGEQIYFGKEMSALTDKAYKYIYHPDDGTEELYDRVSDMKEKNNIAEERRADSRERRNFVQNFIASYQAGFHVRFNRKFQDESRHFVGTVTCSAGIDKVATDRLDTGDIFKDDGTSITFDIRLPDDLEKGFVFQVGDASADVVFDVTADDKVGDASLVHIGPAKEIPGTMPFSVTMNDKRFSLGQPVMLRATDPGMYIWAINPGLVESPWGKLSSEEEERLRSLGYLQ